MRLADLQHSLMMSLHQGAPPLALLTANDGRGWAIYRAGYLASLTEALRDVYPVCDRLVGADCFTALARSYLPQHPSVSADLHCYGAGFAGFLLGFLADLPYLPDVARLEWLAHEAFHAADAPPLDLTRLAAVPAANHALLRFHLHPSVRLMRSDFPVHRIWQVNQPDWTGAESVNLDEGGVALAVYREALEITLLPLGPATLALAESFRAGHDFARACDKLLAAEPDADPGQALHTLLQHGLVVDFTI